MKLISRYSAIVEALKREQDVYRLPLKMAQPCLPHLGLLQEVGSVTRQRTCEAYAREADAAFQTMQDMFGIIGLVCPMSHLSIGWNGLLEGWVGGIGCYQNKHLGRMTNGGGWRVLWLRFVWRKEFQVPWT